MKRRGSCRLNLVMTELNITEAGTVQFPMVRHAAENVFYVTWEWRLKPPARKGNRADVMFVVNGVPVAIVEHKNPKDRNAIERAVTQLKRYEQETPELMGAAQLFNVTHLLDYWYGVTWNVNRRFMARWKERPEESYRFAVQSFFELTDFLRTLRDWILFRIYRLGASPGTGYQFHTL